MGRVDAQIILHLRPDNGDETHQDRNSRGKVGAVVDIAPYLRRGVEFREALRFPVGSCGDHDDDDEESNDVERRSIRVEVGNPPCRHTTDATMDKHD